MASVAMSVEQQAEAPAKRARTSYDHTRQDFLLVFEKLREELVTDDLFEGQPPAAKDWFQELLNYTVPGGKLNRGMAVFDVMRSIKNSEDISEQDILRANILGWCIEWLQAFFLVADDIMDGSITRRGEACWYRMPKVGLNACNDYILLECCIYRILKLHFQSTPLYVKLLDIFHEGREHLVGQVTRPRLLRNMLCRRIQIFRAEVTYQTSHGQLLDLITAPQGTADLTRYSMDAYMRIVTYKTAFYSFYLPVACGMLLAECEEKAFEKAKEICLRMGQYFQIQDDYLDCFADADVLGKIGTDIEDGKCSWLICTALQHASDKQSLFLQMQYGKNDKASVQAVKNVYKALHLEDHFAQFEAKSYAELCQLIEEQDVLPNEVFTRLLNKIYKRTK